MENIDDFPFDELTKDDGTKRVNYATQFCTGQDISESNQEKLAEKIMKHVVNNYEGSMFDTLRLIIKVYIETGILHHDFIFSSMMDSEGKLVFYAWTSKSYEWLFDVKDGNRVDRVDGAGGNMYARRLRSLDGELITS